MYNGLLTACDNCATPLQGRVGTAIKKLDYIEVTGNLMTIIHSKENPEGKTYWAKKREDYTHLHFCRNNVCLFEYLNSKVLLLQEIWAKNENPVGDIDWGAK